MAATNTAQTTPASTDIVVDVNEDEVIEVEVGDQPELALDTTVTPPKEPPELAPRPEPKPRVREPQPSAADEAAAALTLAAKQSEEQRKAAEATAQAERRSREAAERRAAQAEADSRALREQAETSEIARLAANIESTNRELASAKQELIRAQEAGEFPQIAEAQVRLSKAASALDRLEATKADYEAGNRKPTTVGRVEAPQPQIQIDPKEQYISQFPPRAQAFLRTHSDCVPPEIGGDASRNAAMMEGHYAALRKLGKQGEGGDEYFRIIEETLTGKPAAEVEPEVPVAPRQAPRQSKPAPSAPPSRDPPNAQGRTESVRLNALQQEAARISYPHKPPGEAYRLYATELMALTREGKMGRLTH